MSYSIGYMCNHISDDELMYKTEVDPQDVENKCMVAKGGKMLGVRVNQEVYI